MSDTFILVFGIIVLILGLIILYVYFKTVILCRCKILSEITKVKEEQLLIRGSTLHTYRPEFMYMYEGQKYKGVASFSTTNENKYNVGDSLLIYVNVKNPGLYRFSGRFGMLITGLVIFAIGALFTILWFM